MELWFRDELRDGGCAAAGFPLGVRNKILHAGRAVVRARGPPKRLLG